MAHPYPQAGHSGHLARHDGMESGHRSDPYREPGKVEEPSVCPDCGASVHAGRWTWQPAQPGAASHRCPACRRTQDGMPAGELTLEGPFLTAHEEEILRLLDHPESRIRREHPLERRMAMRNEADQERMVLSFTGTHVTHGVAAALLSAFAGEMQAAWPEGGAPLQIRWSR
ncbi:BCAM0308 family protein [Synechococcus sp. CCY 9618]|uniref:BCAM0308 family protein n=1 Tax=Synechococcus sp. CCY 9618 TaxID=2815602 RepID=UPI001C2397E9|nr:BCAM0308 family protein [Synechococcus sp. CCY 9618]